MADPKIRVPANLIPIVQQVADYYGIPFIVLAGSVQLGTSWTNNVDGAFIARVGQAINDGVPAASRNPYSGDESFNPTWADVAAKVFGGGASQQFRTRLGSLMQESATDLTEEDRWTYDKENAAPVGTYRTPAMGPVTSEKVTISSGEGAIGYSAGDIQTLFHQRTGRYPSEGEVQQYAGMSASVADRLISGLPEAVEWRRDGPAIEQARRWADSLSLNLTGRQLTNDEMRGVVQNGWAPGQLETYLKSQKFGHTDVTIGAAVDIRESMKKSFQKIIGRDPTEGEINWAVSNKIPTTNTDALAEQTKTGTVWGSDPQTFTTTRSALRQMMNSFGIVVDEQHIDANLVNQAVSGKWTTDQMKQSIASGQMPGAPAGTTVDHYTTTKAMADSVWKTYFPTQTMPQSYTNQFLTMTPDAITMFVRALPSPEAKAVGTVVPVGVYNDAKNVASRALASLGVIGRDPSAQEIAAFAAGKLDVEAITKHYATDPAVLAINPGAQYGMSRQDYYGNRSGAEKAYADRFGGVDPATLARDQAKVENPTPGAADAEPDWLKAVFKEGLSAEQSATVFDDYFKRLGKAPDASDIYAFKSRSKTVYSDYVGGRTRPEPAVSMAGTQPTLPGLGTNKDKRGFAR